ncbi:MAG: hypothetical protein K0S99_579, partial [Thermomicrobiales bacterium]|nr:hypothetical protein [Thermomicrobiales bacterium]
EGDPRKDCWHGICLGEETDWNDDSDCPCWHKRVGSQYVPF